MIKKTIKAKQGLKEEHREKGERRHKKEGDEDNRVQEKEDYEDRVQEKKDEQKINKDYEDRVQEKEDEQKILKETRTMRTECKKKRERL
jgi:hypothetical protein